MVVEGAVQLTADRQKGQYYDDHHHDENKYKQRNNNIGILSGPTDLLKACMEVDVDFDGGLFCLF